MRGATAPLEVHHQVARCVLRLRDRADACADPLSAEGLALWVDYELEALRWSLDPDISREELAAMIAGSTVEIPREEHRNGHADDFARWGRRGGLATVRRYGTAWFVLLAAKRWERISAEELARTFRAMNGGGADGCPEEDHGEAGSVGGPSAPLPPKAF